MPIEIKELVIRAVLSGPDTDPPDGEGGAPSGAGGAAAQAHDREQIVQECVRQVLRILARQQER